MWTFWPREFWTLDVTALARDYVASETAFTKLHLVDAQTRLVEALQELVLAKARRLKLAMIALASAVFALSAALALQ